MTTPGIGKPQLAFGFLLVLLVLLGSSLTFAVAGQSPIEVLNARFQQAGQITDDIRAQFFADGYDQATVEQEIHHLINEMREQHNLTRLNMDSDLQAIARGHSATMAQEQDLFHRHPSTGATFRDRYVDANYTCRINLDDREQIAVGGENIGRTYWREHTDVDGKTAYYATPSELAQGIVSQWNASEQHREAILQPYWDDEGIGVVRDGASVYVTQNFC